MHTVVYTGAESNPQFWDPRVLGVRARAPWVGPPNATIDPWIDTWRRPQADPWYVDVPASLRLRCKCATHTPTRPCRTSSFMQNLTSLQGQPICTLPASNSAMSVLSVQLTTVIRRPSHLLLFNPTPLYACKVFVQ